MGTRTDQARRPALPSGPAPRGPVTSLASAWQRHRDLLRNTATLLATTGATSALGAAYWGIAARFFSARQVGLGSAAVSAMTLLGTIGMLGLGTVLIGELPRRADRGRLISAALLAAAVPSLMLGIVIALVAPGMSGKLSGIGGSPALVALFCLGTVLTAVSLVFDQATIGLLRGGLQLTRNVELAVVKIALLVALAVFAHRLLGTGITVSWVLATAVSLLLVAIQLRLKGTPVLPKPDWGVLRGLGRTTAAHTWLNIAIGVPQTLYPVLVTVVVSPRANAYFYAAWTISTFLRIVPTHLATVLFAVTSADPKVIATKVRFTLRLSAMIGIPGMIALILGSHLALGILFGARYAEAASVPLVLLVLGYLPSVPRTHYIAVCRATGHISRAAVVLTTTLGLEIAAVALGGKLDGLTGVAAALLAVYAFEGLVTAPRVLRAAFGAGKHRRMAPAAVSRAPYPRSAAAGGLKATAPGAGRASSDAPASSAAAKRRQQEAGIDLLLSLARSATTTAGIPVIREEILAPER